MKLKSTVSAKLIFLLITFIILTSSAFSQDIPKINRDILYNTWEAKWITCPGISGKEFGVYLFRKTFQVNSEAKEFIVHVSADNRYKLLVNGKYVCNGPARGDFLKWRFETVDILPYLQKGKNVITAVVWNFAEFRPAAQFSEHTGFILQGNSKVEHIVNSDSTWKVIKDSAYNPLPALQIKRYYAVGPGEEINYKFHPWNWEDLNYDDSRWENAKEIESGTPMKSFKEYGAVSDYILIPREIPLMEERVERFKEVRRSNLNIPEQFINGKESFTLPAHTSATILFDQKYLTNAYLVLKFSKGNKSKIILTYAESMVNDKGEKGNRNDIENKKIIGNQDAIISNGGADRTFQTLWFRTFRYVQMKIKTYDEPLTINDFYSIYTGYPFKEKAYFKSSDSILSKIWKVGWHTQQLCTGETFYDCPYYEQLQYEGDTRIQCLTSFYVSGDSIMMRKAVQSFYDSRLYFGLLQSRYPCYLTQVIPTYSLVWVTMIHDYWMLCDDPGFIKKMIPGIMEVLVWYKSKIDSSGLLGYMEWWNFVDWVNFEGWYAGIPPGLDSSYSSIINLQYVYTLQKAAEVFNAFKLNDKASEYLQQAEKIKTKIYTNCYDKQNGLISDTPQKKYFSQHANILAILTNTFPESLQPKIMTKIIDNNDIAQCSYYFKFYLFEALEKTGMTDKFIGLLSPWIQMLNLGLTTFAEMPEPTRSDCHAWSASPVYYLLSLVCGLKPKDPGFNSVSIKPHLGNLNWINASMPYRSGNIKISLKKENESSITGEVILPSNLTGVFIWKNYKKLLKDGINYITITN